MEFLDCCAFFWLVLFSSVVRKMPKSTKKGVKDKGGTVKHQVTATQTLIHLWERRRKRNILKEKGRGRRKQEGTGAAAAAVLVRSGQRSRCLVTNPVELIGSLHHQTTDLQRNTDTDPLLRTLRNIGITVISIDWTMTIMDTDRTIGEIETDVKTTTSESTQLTNSPDHLQNCIVIIIMVLMETLGPLLLMPFLVRMSPLAAQDKMGFPL